MFLILNKWWNKFLYGWLWSMYKKNWNNLNVYNEKAFFCNWQHFEIEILNLSKTKNQRGYYQHYIDMDKSKLGFQKLSESIAISTTGFLIFQWQFRYRKSQILNEFCYDCVNLEWLCIKMNMWCLEQMQ